MTGPTKTQTPVPQIPRTAQLVLFLDILGNPHAEMPGANGNRQKIELAPDFATRNPELMLVLRTEKLRLADQARAAIRQAPPERIDPQLARERRIEAAQVEHARQWLAYLDTLTEAERERQIAKRNEKLAKAKEAELARARSVYLDIIANHHDANFANRVIPDPKRRPRRKITVGVYAVSPQNETAMAQALAGTKPKTKRTYSKAKVVKIEL